MKNVLSKLLLGIAICSFASCANESDEVAPQSVERADIEVINGGQLLRFKDNNVYDETLQKVSAMTDKERAAFFSSLSFKPQMIIMKEADAELRNICESTRVLAVAEKQYSEFKQKYSKVFMFNDSDVSDLSPYSRLVSPSNEFFANVNGQFMIGDSLIESVVFKSFNERLKQTQIVMTRGISNNDAVNDAYSHQSDRKVGLRLFWGNGLIQANFTSQKKVWLGWHRYDTEYHANFRMSSGGGFEFAEGALLGTVTPFVNKDNIPFSISTKERSGNFTTVFGRVTNGRTCFGNMEIWSRGVIYANRGFASINL